MPKTKEQKKQIIEDLKDKLSKQKIVIFTDITKLTVLKTESLRKNLRKENAEFKVIKKTLIKKAFGNKDYGVDPQNLKGEIALVLGLKDEIAPAKIIYKFAKENDKIFGIVGGILQDKFMEKEKIIQLAKLPSYSDLVAKLVGTLSAPISGLVNVLQGNLRNFVYLLSVIKK